MKFQLSCVAVLLAFVSAPLPAGAKDLVRLAELLTPSYTAMDFSALCTARNPWYALTVRGPMGPMPAYAQHIKGEVIAGLPDGQARFVMVGAADASKATALAQLRKFGPRLATDERRLEQWCDLDAKRFIIDVMADHDTRHPILLKKIDEAKSD